MTPPVERRKTDLLDDPIDEDILREIREATDEAEKRRLMIDYQINRQLWRLGTLVSEISGKLTRQDETFAQHREEIKAIMAAADAEYRAHRAEFMKHARDEEMLIASGQTAYRTAYRIGAGVVALILALIGYIARMHLEELRDTQNLTNTAVKGVGDLHHRMDLLDSAFSRHMISGVTPKNDTPPQHGLRIPEH